MISQEAFDVVVNKIVNDQPLTTAEAVELVQTIAELDGKGKVAEGIVQFVLHGIEIMYNDVAQNVVRELNLRDTSKKKRIMRIGTEAAGKLIEAVQVYTAQLYIQEEQEAQRLAAANVSEKLPEGETPA
jgi:hypothetical protein